MSSDPIDPKLIRELADILADTGLTEIEVEQGSLKIKVARKIQAVPAPQQVTYAAPPPMTAAPAAHAVAPAAAVEAPASRGEPVKSPMVGTVYLQAQPGAPAFIKIGDKVSEGQTLVIVEAMKTMNPIPSPRAGTIVDILVGDAQPVEFGEPLVMIE